MSDSIKPSSIPIFLMSFNRPEYLRRVLDSLSKQVDCDIGQRQIFLFQDGAVNPHSKKRYAGENEILGCIDAFRQEFPYGRVVASPINLGIALNFERAEKLGFEDLAAEAIIFLEDDLVLNQYYINVLDNLICRFLADERIGYLAAYGDHTAPLEAQHQKKHELILMEHNWGFALYRRQWRRMRRQVLEYLEIVGESDYNDRDVTKIRALFASWGYGCPATSQDAAKTIACCMDGVIKINTYACNGLYIGEQGVHMNADLFAKRGYHRTRLYGDKITKLDELDARMYEVFLTRQKNWAGSPATALQAENGIEIRGRNGWPAADPIMIGDQPDASALLSEGKSASDRGDVGETIKIYARGMQIFPHVVDKYEDPVFGKESMRLLLSRGDIAAAVEVRQRLQNEHGPFQWDQVLFARHYTEIGNTEKALEAWRSILARIPNDPESLEGIARLELHGRGDPRLKAYFVDGAFNTIAGACDGETLYRINQFHELQVELGIVGDLLEIGVYQGRLFLMLALLARPQERAIAIDVFDVDRNYDSRGGVTSLEVVKGNYRKFVDPGGDLNYIARDSLFLEEDEVKQKLSTGHARMVSIDGAHSAEHTEHDLRLAECILAPGGIVMVDDITNSGWPGVMEGVARYFLSGSDRRLLPFMMSLNKLWLTTCQFQESYLDFAVEKVRVTRVGQQKRTTKFFGSNIVGW